MAALMTIALFSWPVFAAQKEPVKVSSQEMRLVVELKEKKDDLEKREKLLAKREAELAGVGKEVDEKLAHLLDLQEDLQRKLDELKTIKDKRFKNLVKIYSEMSATKLAPILNQMEDDTVAEILRAMKAPEVAKIIPKLDEGKAVRVSRLLGMIP